MLLVVFKLAWLQRKCHTFNLVICTKSTKSTIQIVTQQAMHTDCNFTTASYYSLISIRYRIVENFGGKSLAN